MAKRILIVDDHGMVRHHLCSLIESHEGWQVCGWAEDGVEAVEKVATLSPDAIILDLAMPRMDGLKATREIRIADAHVPIVLHTVHLSPEVQSAAQAFTR